MVASFFFTTLQCGSLPYSEKQSISSLEFDMGRRARPGPEEEEDEDMKRAIAESLAENAGDITDL